MEIRIYVLDTSYLLELFRVPGDSTEEYHRQAKQQFKDALEKRFLFYVPIPVLFELANHIADVRDFSHRKALATDLRDTVSSCLEKASPWVITPLGEPGSIAALMSALDKIAGHFADEFSNEGLGLTDTAVILEARRIRKKYSSSSVKQYFVHIWTQHAALKAHEPDREPV
jgi:hypothetical protein